MLPFNVKTSHLQGFTIVKCVICSTVKKETADDVAKKGRELRTVSCYLLWVLVWK